MCEKKPAFVGNKTFYGWTHYNSDHQKRSDIFSKKVTGSTIARWTNYAKLNRKLSETSFSLDFC